jgi:hypothetical protein
VYRGDKAGWEAPALANRVDFEGLVRSLQDYWSSISAKFPDVDDITVIGIDLTKRSS